MNTRLLEHLGLVCLFWGLAILFNQHHPVKLIPILGFYLLGYSIGALMLAAWKEWKT